MAAGSHPLRIGLYTSSLPQSHRKPPGVDVFVDRLAEHLACRGHHVTVFSYSPAADQRSYELRTLSPENIATSNLRRMLIAPIRLNMIDTSGLDLLHLHGDDWFYLRRPVPTVRTFHGSAIYEARYATRARRRAWQYATYGLEIAASRIATRAYGVIPGDGPGYGTAGHLRLGVDLPTVHSFRREGPPTVLFVGTWLGRKRGWLLHQTFLRDVLPRIPDARLVMVSDHCEPGPNIDWLPRPSDAELSELYRSAWVFSLPSAYEGFGLPFLESMAHGTPVIATSSPGSRFVLEAGRHGLLVDDATLGDQIARLLIDENARTAIAEAGRRRAEEFHWDGVLDEHETVYREAIAAFRPFRSPGFSAVPRRAAGRVTSQ
jgi:glycosyltransferase involved in cell wall biosynthesis